MISTLLDKQRNTNKEVNISRKNVGKLCVIGRIEAPHIRKKRINDNFKLFLFAFTRKIFLSLFSHSHLLSLDFGQEAYEIVFFINFEKK
ncbi:hypothetical protein BGL48_02590 [Salinivibrio sp. SS3]|nr:hypothetical protein BGL48_02590 [Salinivibrio sp. BNH]